MSTENTLVLNLENSGGSVTLNSEKFGLTYNADDTQPRFSYYQITFNSKYQAVLNLNQTGDNHMAIFQGAFDIQSHNTGIATKFTGIVNGAGGRMIPEENLLLLNDTALAHILIFEAGDIITIAVSGRGGDSTETSMDINFKAFGEALDALNNLSFSDDSILQLPLANLSFTQCSISSMSGKDFNGSSFNDCTLSSVSQNDFTDGTFGNSTISDLSNNNLSDSIFTNCTFSGLSSNNNFMNCLSTNCVFTGSFVEDDFRNTTFIEADFENSIFNKIKIDTNTTWSEGSNFDNLFTEGIVGITKNLPNGYAIRHGSFFGDGINHALKEFGSVDLRNLSFLNNNLEGADLSMAQLGNNISGGIQAGPSYILVQQLDSRETATGGLNFFGYVVSMSRDGKTVAVGNPRSQTSAPYEGKAQVFQEIDGEWSQKGDDILGLEAEAQFGDQFGFSVSLSPDGNILAIGGIQYGSEVGFVKVVQYVDGNWTPLGQIIKNETGGTQGGWVVALAQNGYRVALSARSNDSNSLTNNGELKVYDYIDGDWEQVGSDIEGLLNEGQFGQSMDMAINGNYIAASSYQGNVRVFSDQNGVWEQIGDTIMTAYDEVGESRTYTRLAVTEDGKTVLAEAHKRGDSSKDYIRTYKLNDATGQWEEKAPALEAEGFISRIAMTKDGSSLIVADGISAKLYKWDGSQWTGEATVRSPDGNFSPRAVDLGEDLQGIVVGSYSTSQAAVYSRRSFFLPVGYGIDDEGRLTYTAPFNDICFDPREIVETDQGNVKIKYIDTDVNTIRGQPILKLTQTRCLEPEMILVEKDRFGKNIPNKDTRMSLNHKVHFKGQMVAAKNLPRGDGIELIDSEHRVLYNVMLPKYTYMKVNNMIVETLRPMKHL